MVFNNNQIFSIKESRNQGIKTKNASQQNSDKGNAAQASSNKNDVDANVKINIACTKQCRGGQPFRNNKNLLAAKALR